MSRKWERAVRRDMERVLSNLDERWVTAASAQICTNLCELVNKTLELEVRHILAFVPHFQGEVDLTQFIAAQFGDRKVYLPRVSSSGALSYWTIANDWQSSLVSGFRGIPEPAGVCEQFLAEFSEQTLALIPGLAFDRDGNRLGRDIERVNQFFGRQSLRAIQKVGVAWSLQIMPELSMNSDHVIMDWICDERRSTRVAYDFIDRLEEE